MKKTHRKLSDLKVVKLNVVSMKKVKEWNNKCNYYYNE